MKVLAVRIDEWNPSDRLFDDLLSTLDLESQDRVKCYRFKEDSKRSIIGRLLPRYILSKYFNVNWYSIDFGKTPENRPFYTSPSNLPIVDYNVSHDGAYVLIGFTLEHNSRIGVDVTKLTFPKNSTPEEFYEAFETQMHETESKNLNSMPNHESKLRRLLSLWTLKEAYTKALGFGLGFDFSRVAFEFPNDNQNVNDDVKINSASSFISGLMVDSRNVKLGYTSENVLNRWGFFQRQLNQHLIAVSLRDGSHYQYENNNDWLEELDIEKLVHYVLEIKNNSRD